MFISLLLLKTIKTITRKSGFLAAKYKEMRNDSSILDNVYPKQEYHIFHIVCKLTNYYIAIKKCIAMAWKNKIISHPLTLICNYALLSWEMKILHDTLYSGGTHV